MENSYNTETNNFNNPQTFEAHSTFLQSTGVQVKLDSSSVKPRYHSLGSVGADLSCFEDIILDPYMPTLVDTGVSIALPSGTAGLIYLRSSIALQGLMLCNGVGVIDTDYRGNIKLLLMNITDTPKSYLKNSRLAQLIITPILTPKFIEVTELDHTNREANGFGSTGVR